MALPLTRPRAPTAAAQTIRLLLFGGPYVEIDDHRIEVPEGSKRLLVFVTLQGCRVSRHHAAGTLWPDGDDVRAAGNLRSALWRLRGASIDVLQADRSTLRLDPAVIVDVEELNEWADRIIHRRGQQADIRPVQLNPEVLHLLPGWYDDWVLFERERIRQRVLHALEALSRHLAVERRHADSVEVAMTAVRVDPLRESAQRALIEAHLAEHNWVEARRAFGSYCDLLHAELGVAPSNELRSLLKRPLVEDTQRRDSHELLPRHRDGWVGRLVGRDRLEGVVPADSPV
jgi:DNA-binding SARP family transcriptional activator